MDDGRTGLVAVATLLVVATLSGTSGAPMAVLAVSAAIGIAVLVLRGDRATAAVLVPPVVVAVMAITAVTTWKQITASGNEQEAGLWLVLGLALVVFSLTRQGAGLRWVLLLAGTACLGLAGLSAAVPIDVVEAHEVAGERLLSGESPFRDLGVVETDPIEDGSVIDGYPYPPVNLLVFGVLGTALGSPRLVALALWVAVVALAALHYGIRSPAPTLLAVLPGYPLTVFAGWTEPLTVLLLLAALALRSWGGRGAAAGAMLVSKQYMVAGAAAVLAAWWHRRRMVVVLLLVGAAVTVPVLLDLAGAYESLVVFHTAHLVRPDSSNLAGVMALSSGWTHWPLPSVVVFVTAAVIGAVVGRRRPGASSWLPGLLVALVVILLLGPVSLPNYWLVGAAALTCWFAESESAPREGSARGEAATGGCRRVARRRVARSRSRRLGRSGSG